LPLPVLPPRWIAPDWMVRGHSFCTAKRCPVIIGNTLAYFDQKHSTIEYAELLASVLGALADRALAGG
jgi:hypothetical protein